MISEVWSIVILAVFFLVWLPGMVIIAEWGDRERRSLKDFLQKIKENRITRQIEREDRRRARRRNKK